MSKKVLARTIDCEPTWKQLLPVLLEIKDKEIALKELSKIAVVADLVRQAQKNDKVLVFLPDGSHVAGINVMLDGKELKEQVIHNEL